MKYTKIKDNPYLIKDNHSKAILNTNKSEIIKYLSEANKQKKIEKLESDIDILKRQITLLTNLLIKSKNNVNE